MSSEQLDALERLARLKGQGMLTDDEFQKQKASILTSEIPIPEPLLKADIKKKSSVSSPIKKNDGGAGNVVTFLMLASFLSLIGYFIYAAFREDNTRKEIKRSEPGLIRQVATLVNNDEIVKARAFADSVIEHSEHKDKLGRLGLVRDTLFKATDEEFLQQTIVDLPRSRIDSLKKGKAPSFFKNTHINSFFVAQIRNNLVNKQQFKERLAHREEMLGNARNKAMASRYFKTGRNRDWERAIKSQLKDPDSYDHEDTVYEVTDGSIHVTTKFRAKNSFSALEIGYAEGILSLTTGNIVSCKISN